ncbi:MAG: RnfABCDGE type electron transport complex subunit D [Leptospiraceae bacterium]|nr:RnfABCDGE type electron transport complex subunit D [Leptospiraceae bacterium]
MSMPQNPLIIRTSPHLKGTQQTDRIMLHVVLSLLPVCGAAVYFFGLSAIALMLTCVVFSVATEYVANRLAQKPPSINDWSAALTGLLLALTLPPGLPLWMAALGSIVAVAFGKALFGGLGNNLFNPALVGRAFLQAAFPVALTTWVQGGIANRFVNFYATTLTLPFTIPDPGMLAAEALSGATPLSALKFDHTTTASLNLFLGNINGSLGETSAVLILLGGVYLALRRMLDWRIPAAIISTVALLSGMYYFWNADGTMHPLPTPQFMLGAGGLFLGAVYMATDMVTSPITPMGVWIYGILIGTLVVVIRIWGGLPEGVMYSILLGNALTPLIDRYTRTRVFGSKQIHSKTS